LHSTIGLLFGEEDSDDHQLNISIIDSEEVEPIHNTTLEPEQVNRIRTKIELHQKVFPQHHVVGWYKVVDERSADFESDKNYALPTKNDLITHSGWMRDFNENPIFLLMNASKRKDSDVESSLQSPDDHAKNARTKLEREEELPLSVYESIMNTDNGGTVFVNLEFEIETFDPERIAVERVLKSQKPDFQLTQRQGKVKSLDDTVEKKELLGESDIEMSTEEADAASDPPSTAVEIHLRSVISSIDAMNTRATILLDFLEKTHSKQIPVNHELLRQVNSLVKQMPFIMAYSAANSTNNNSVRRDVFDEDYLLVMSYLATITKTTNSVLQYSKKVGTLLQK
jgi:hypothetical protein